MASAGDSELKLTNNSSLENSREFINSDLIIANHCNLKLSPLSNLSNSTEILPSKSNYRPDDSCELKLSLENLPDCSVTSEQDTNNRTEHKSESSKSGESFESSSNCESSCQDESAVVMTEQEPSTPGSKSSVEKQSHLNGKSEDRFRKLSRDSAIKSFNEELTVELPVHDLVAAPGKVSGCSSSFGTPLATSSPSFSQLQSASPHVVSLVASSCKVSSASPVSFVCEDGEDQDSVTNWSMTSLEAIEAAVCFQPKALSASPNHYNSHQTTVPQQSASNESQITSTCNNLSQENLKMHNQHPTSLLLPATISFNDNVVSNNGKSQSGKRDLEHASFDSDLSYEQSVEPKKAKSDVIDMGDSKETRCCEEEALAPSIVVTSPSTSQSQQSSSCSPTTTSTSSNSEDTDSGVGCSNDEMLNDFIDDSLQGEKKCVDESEMGVCDGIGGGSRDVRMGVGATSKNSKHNVDRTFRPVRKRSIHFGNVTVYYFSRAQGFTCVPAQGGSTLGMSPQHEAVEQYSFSDYKSVRHCRKRQLLKDRTALKFHNHHQHHHNHQTQHHLNQINQLNQNPLVKSTPLPHSPPASVVSSETGPDAEQNISSTTTTASNDSKSSTATPMKEPTTTSYSSSNTGSTGLITPESSTVVAQASKVSNNSSSKSERTEQTTDVNLDEQDSTVKSESSEKTAEMCSSLQRDDVISRDDTPESLRLVGDQSSTKQFITSCGLESNLQEHEACLDADEAQLEAQFETNCLTPADYDNMTSEEIDDSFCLEVVPLKKRRKLLKESGIDQIDVSEHKECEWIRVSREDCGCNCRVVCDPRTCLCAINGIKCQVDRQSYPCGCTKQGCGNASGRIEFNLYRVRTHFFYTLLRLQQHRNNSVEPHTQLSSANSRNILAKNLQNCSSNSSDEEEDDDDELTDSKELRCGSPDSFDENEDERHSEDSSSIIGERGECSNYCCLGVASRTTTYPDESHARMMQQYYCANGLNFNHQQTSGGTATSSHCPTNPNLAHSSSYDQTYDQQSKSLDCVLPMTGSEGIGAMAQSSYQNTYSNLPVCSDEVMRNERGYDQKGESYSTAKCHLRTEVGKTGSSSVVNIDVQNDGVMTEDDTETNEDSDYIVETEEDNFEVVVDSPEHQSFANGTTSYQSSSFQNSSVANSYYNSSYGNCHSGDYQLAHHVSEGMGNHKNMSVSGADNYPMSNFQTRYHDHTGNIATPVQSLNHAEHFLNSGNTHVTANENHAGSHLTNNMYHPPLTSHNLYGQNHHANTNVSGYSDYVQSSTPYTSQNHLHNHYQADPRWYQGQNECQMYPEVSHTSYMKNGFSSQPTGEVDSKNAEEGTEAAEKSCRENLEEEVESKEDACSKEFSKSASSDLALPELTSSNNGGFENQPNGDCQNEEIPLVPKVTEHVN